MAVVKYSPLIEQLRGKLNGTVFSKYLDGFSAYKKGQPSPVGSRRQQNIRQNFQVMAGRWGELPQAERTAWEFVAANTLVKNRLGESVHISGYAYYLKFNLAYQAQDQTTYPTPTTTLNPAYITEIANAELAITQQGDMFQVTRLYLQSRILTTSLEQNHYSIYVSLPFDREDQSYDRTYYYATYASRGGGSTPGQTYATTQFNLNMPSAFYSYEGAWHEIKIIYRTGSSAQESEPTFFKVQADFTPPVTVYEPELEAAMQIFDVIPTPQQLENLNVWILALKDAADLTIGVFNLNQAYDAVYNFAVNTFHNARIDYTTSALRATEIADPGFNIQFQAFRGISRGSGGTVALDTNWNVTAPGQNATESDNHQSISVTTSDAESMTGRIAGSQLENFEFILLQNVSGTPSFRVRSGGLALSNLPSANTRGGYAVSRTSTANLLISKNAAAPISFTNILQGYTSETFLLLSTKASGTPEAPRAFTQIASFTAGTANVDLQALNAAIRNYLSNYGFELY